MKIIITRFPYESQFSGLEWHTIDLAERLRKRGHSVQFIGSCPVLLKELGGRGFSVIRQWVGIAPVSKGALAAFPLLFPWTLFQCIRIALRARRDGVTHVYMLTLPEKLVLTPIAHFLGMKVVWSEHERLGRWLFGNPLFLLYRWWARWVSLVTNSEESRRLFERRGIFAQHIVNGTDLATFAPRVHRAISAVSRTKRIGTIARLTPDKGISDFIHAAHLVVAQRPGVQFFIVGEGVLREQLQREIVEQGVADHVKMVGFLPREKVVQFLHSLDLFVLPSALHDPFGFVAAEAMACGVPTIVTDACGIVHWTKANEHLAVCKAQDPQDLARTMTALLDQPERAQALAQAGQAHARAHFGLEEMVSQYEKVFAS